MCNNVVSCACGCLREVGGLSGGGWGWVCVWGGGEGGGGGGRGGGGGGGGGELQVDINDVSIATALQVPPRDHEVHHMPSSQLAKQ